MEKMEKNGALIISILDALAITGVGLYLNKEISEVNKEVSLLQTEVNDRNEIVKYLKGKEDEFKKLESYIRNSTSIQGLFDRDKQMSDIMTVLTKLFQQVDVLHRKVISLETELTKYKSGHRERTKEMRTVPPPSPKYVSYESEEEEQEEEGEKEKEEEEDEDVKSFMNSMNA
jgi:hypothetical protein